MNKWVRIIAIGILLVLLVLVRSIGSKLFYDPFIAYFKEDYLHGTIPDFGALKLFSHLFLRYLINALISLGIIYVAFLNIRLIRFSIKFFSIAFILLSVVYYFLLKAGMVNGYLFTFYIRRFLIHPVFLLILLPAFYYQKKLVEQSE